MNYTYYRRYQNPRRGRKQSSFKPFFLLVIFLVVFALIMNACVSFVMDRNEERRDEAVLVLERGSAEILFWGQDKWEDTSDSQIILEGDSVRTAEGSYVYLTFHNGSGLRLDQNSHIVFSECVKAGDDDLITLALIDGRAWIEKLPKEKGDMEIVLETDVMNISAASSKYLVSNLMDDEYVYVLDGQVMLEFLSRGSSDMIIETAILDENYKVEMSDSKQRALLNRENVVLVEEIEEGELFEDEFMVLNYGTLVFDEEESDLLDDGDDGEGQEAADDSELEEAEGLDGEAEEDESLEPSDENETDIEDQEVLDEEGEFDEEESEIEEIDVSDLEVEEDEEVSLETLLIGVSSPSSPIMVYENAIAIEGYISSGDVDSVYVTWSGNGESYPLGLYEAGSDSFRYVADVNYANFALGENTYTITAYDVVGNESNTISVVITWAE